jgi:hypothetical protein
MICKLQNGSRMSTKLNEPNDQQIPMGKFRMAVTFEF